MVNQDLIHLKFEYEEARNSKMQLLSLEKDLLTIAQTMKDYNLLRTNELDSKAQLQLKTKSVLNDLRKIHRILPKSGMPKILENKKQSFHKTKKKEKKYNSDIASQLKDIQNQLNELSK